jgi:ribonuclease D
MTLITTTEDLARFCAPLHAAGYITVDTEFMREKTYWPKLCLVQIGGPEGAAAIDPLADGIDLAPLYALMQDQNVLKVFHAARQDVEIFVNLTGKVPEPMFDTQVAGMVCGFGESVSYENLIARLVGAKIDKSSRFTDWSHRPLTEKQVVYALGDVIHLRPAYEKLREKLEKTGRGEWLDDEMAILTDPATYRTEPMESWQRLRIRGGKPRFLAILQELCAWRELEAQRLDIPRSRLLRDEALMEIAHHPPKDAASLSRIRGLSQGFADGKSGTAILEAVARAEARPLDQCPAPEEHRDNPAGIGPVVELLRVLLKMVSDDEGVAAKLLASSSDLDLIAGSDAPDVQAMQGWRYDIFGKKAMALKNGQLMLAIQNRKVKLVSPP